MDGSGETEILDTQRPGRRAAAIAALATLAVLAVLVVFLVLDNLGLIVALGLLLALFFAGTWGALSRREWWRWLSGAAGAVGAIGARNGDLAREGWPQRRWPGSR